MSKASNPRLDDARKILFEAVSADSRQETQIAIKKYIEGVDILMCIYNECDEGQQKIALKRQIEGYLDRVEAIKSNGQLLVRVRLHSQVRICDNDTGYDYETLFGVCFGDGVTQIDVEDPYIQNHYQVRNFSMFAGLVFRRCKNLKRISLATIAYCESNAPLEELKQILKCKSEKRPEGVALEINYRDRSQLHDREIRFNSGWIVKLGRGLDIYKAAETACGIDVTDYFFRRCKPNSIDIFRFNKL